MFPSAWQKGGFNPVCLNMYNYNFINFISRVNKFRTFKRGMWYSMWSIKVIFKYTTINIHVHCTSLPVAEPILTFKTRELCVHSLNYPLLSDNIRNRSKTIKETYHDCVWVCVCHYGQTMGRSHGKSASKRIFIHFVKECSGTWMNRHYLI